MCICRLLLFLPPPEPLFLPFSYTFLGVYHTTFLSQLTGFYEKDARGLRVTHAEPLIGALHPSILRLSTISLLHFLYLLAVSGAFKIFMQLQHCNSIKFQSFHISTHEQMKVLYRLFYIVPRNKCISEVIW